MDFAKEHKGNEDWSIKPDADRLTTLIDWVKEADRKIDAENFRNWLSHHVAYRRDPANASCPNGDRDHGCARGLGRFLGIEPYGQGVDGKIPWNQQTGYSAERMMRFVDPIWKAAVLAADFETQKKLYVDMLTTLRDTGEFVYDWSEVKDLVQQPGHSAAA